MNSKKVSSCFLATLLCLNVLSPLYSVSTHAETLASNQFAPEDINNDGIIDVNDLSLLSTKYNLSPSDKTFFNTFDINKDGIIDLYDIVAVSSKINGQALKSLDKTTNYWWYIAKTDHTIPGVNIWNPYNLDDYDVMYTKNPTEKVIHLTFDTEFETNLKTTERLLDTFKANNIKVTFFVMADYINTYPEIVKRMVAEGHTVGSHSKTHNDMTSFTSNVEQFNEEILLTSRNYKNLIGQEMPKFFRPPMGMYNEQSLLSTKKLGYKSVFWTYTHNDYDINNQPNVDSAKKALLDNIHPGEIILLHACSETDTQMMDSVIKECKNQGYSFDSL